MPRVHDLSHGEARTAQHSFVSGVTATKRFHVTSSISYTGTLLSLLFFLCTPAMQRCAGSYRGHFRATECRTLRSFAVTTSMDTQAVQTATTVLWMSCDWQGECGSVGEKMSLLYALVAFDGRCCGLHVWIRSVTSQLLSSICPQIGTDCLIECTFAEASMRHDGWYGPALCIKAWVHLSGRCTSCFSNKSHVA